MIFSYILTDLGEYAILILLIMIMMIHDVSLRRLLIQIPDAFHLHYMEQE